MFAFLTNIQIACVIRWECFYVPQEKVRKIWEARTNMHVLSLESIYIMTKKITNFVDLGGKYHGMVSVKFLLTM